MEKGPIPLARDRAFFVILLPLTLPGEERRQDYASGIGSGRGAVKEARYYLNATNRNLTSFCGILNRDIIWNRFRSSECSTSNYRRCSLPLRNSLFFRNCRTMIIIRILQRSSHYFCICSTNICKVNGLTALLQLVCENGDCNGNEDGDDRNDDQELGQGKALVVVFLHVVSPFHLDLLVGIRIDRQTWFKGEYWNSILSYPGIASNPNIIIQK